MAGSALRSTKGVDIGETVAEVRREEKEFKAKATEEGSVCVSGATPKAPPPKHEGGAPAKEILKK